MPTLPGASVSFPLEATRFVVDARASEIRLLVFRDGPLARFGHNHVIVGPVRGEIRAGDGATGGFRLEIPVESFEIDPPKARSEEGEEFAAEVSDQAREGTRANMLGANLLDAAHYPLIRIDSLALAGPRSDLVVTARATLRGAGRDLRIHAAVEQRGDSLAVTAQFRFRQSDFGIQPFSALGGGLLVRDAVDVRIRLTARRA